VRRFGVKTPNLIDDEFSLVDALYFLKDFYFQYFSLYIVIVAFYTVVI
jgi:hypothetical protein